MKNIHIIPTDKPSIFYYNEINKNYFINKKIKMPHLIEDENQNIYITSDDEINQQTEPCWCINTIKNTWDKDLIYYQGAMPQYHFVGFKKIILTTDQDLVADGVQGIDDEFLEWFVKNPSCEEVEFTRPNKCKVVGCDLECILFKTCENIYIGYKIIIPKEEPKQETFEEYLQRLKYRRTEGGYKYTDEDFEKYKDYIFNCYETNLSGYKCLEFMYFVERDIDNQLFNREPKQETLKEVAEKSFGEIWSTLTTEQSKYLKGYINRQIENAKKWQQENSYSEEDMRKAFIAGGNSQIEEDDAYGNAYIEYMEEWFEQFKKK